MAQLKKKVADAMARTLQGGLGGCSAENVDRYAKTNEGRCRRKVEKGPEEEVYLDEDLSFGEIRAIMALNGKHGK